MKTHTIKTYSFNELSPSAQEYAIDSNRDINTEDSNWYTYIIEAQKEMLSSYGFNNAEIFFSGFYSQWDGACFTCNDIDLEKLIPKLALSDEDIRALQSTLFNCVVYRTSLSNHYNHEYTATFNADFSGDTPHSIVLDFQNKAEALRVQLCKDIFKYLEEEYEYQLSDEAVKRALIDNEFEFLADGKRYF